MAELIEDRLPLGKKLRLLVSKAGRKALRTFAGYPAAPYQVIVDVGAARGDYGARAALVLDVRRVVMVEALPDAAARLRTRFAGDQRFTVVEAALADACGQATFHVNESEDSSSILPVSRVVTETAFGRSFQTAREIVVKTLTLDELHRQEKLDIVDLLKVDIQGAEGRLIAGGGEALARTRAALLEVNFERFYDGAPLFHEIDAMMTDRGFRLRSLLKPRLAKSGKWLAYANALYVNTRL